MTATQTLIERNRAFANDFAAADLPSMPKLGTVVITCADSRVDPAHFAGLELGDAAVIRNAGARVTPEVIKELAFLSFLAKRMTGSDAVPMELVIIQHTDCGAERLANPQLQALLKENLGIDVSHNAIHDHEASIHEDVARLREASAVPNDIVVSAFLYDVKDGQLREVMPAAPLSAIEKEEVTP